MVETCRTCVLTICLTFYNQFILAVTVKVADTAVPYFILVCSTVRSDIIVKRSKRNINKIIATRKSLYACTFRTRSRSNALSI